MADKRHKHHRHLSLQRFHSLQRDVRLERWKNVLDSILVIFLISIVAVLLMTGEEPEQDPVLLTESEKFSK